jgi:hypothetical protein
MKYYENFKPKSESFESFVARNLKTETSKVSKDEDSAIVTEGFEPRNFSGLVNPEYDNVLFVKGARKVKGYEVNIKKERGNYYSFTETTIPKKIKTKFGCELETCFVLNCKSKKAKEDVYRILSGDKPHRFTTNSDWQNLITYHLRNNIIPFLKPEFTKIFRYAYIVSEYIGYVSNNLLIDMSNGEIQQKVSIKEGDYKTLIFYADGSINCNFDEKSIPILCEIITPVLSDVDELRILYEGLISNSCNQSNASMGFHVNVSAVNEKDETVELSDSILSEIIYNWLPYENKNYKSLRGEKESSYAQKIQKFYDDIEGLIEENKHIKTIYNEPLNISEIYEPYNVGIKTMVNKVNTDKYLSMTHHKKNNVIEFRIFGGTKNIDSLLKYTQDAIDVFHNSVQGFCDKPEQIIAKIQSSNLRYKYIDKIFPPKSIDFDDIYEMEKYFDKNYANIITIYSTETKKQPGFLGYLESKILKSKSYKKFYDGIIERPGNYGNFTIIFKITDYSDLSEKYYQYDLEKISRFVKLTNLERISFETLVNLKKDESFKTYSYYVGL